MENNFDLLVLGAGPGGYVAAIRAAQLGLRTAVVEKGNVGGVCLNIGCIPSKNLIGSASRFAERDKLEAFGLRVDASGFDYGAVHAQSRQAAETLSKGVRYLLDKNGVALIQDEGRLTGPQEITTRSGAVLTGKNILIATGSRPRELPGLAFDGRQVLSSDDILLCDTLPRSICIVGGGAIGCEFAYILRSFGVEVTLVEMTTHLLPYEDGEVAKALVSSFKKKKIAVHLSAKAAIVARGDASVTVEIRADSGKTKQVEVERVLAVVGRAPNTAGLGLEELGIGLERGFIPVDGHCRTALPSVYAIGDVVNTPMLAHVASKEGEIAVEHMAGKAAGEPEDFAPLVPNCVYCEPQVAGFGLTQEKAQEKGLAVKTFQYPFRAVGKAVATGKAEGFVKLLTDAEGKLLGAHIIGPDATELIHELALAAGQGIPVQEIARTVHAHPTLSEAVMECARGFENWMIHV